MEIIYFMLFVLLFFALYCVFLTLFRVPSKQSGKNLKMQIISKTKTSTRLFNTIIMPLVKPISLLIRINPAVEANMARMLHRGGLDLTPKEYYARAIICAVLTLPLSLFLLMLGTPQLMPITLILSFVIYLHYTTDLKDKLKEKRDRIEASLPSFIRAILYKIDQENAKVQVNLISVFEDYLKVANEVFRYDIAILVTEMKSMDIQTALRNFDNRVNLTELSFLINALIGLERGEQQSDTLAALARDMDMKARENIRKQLAKRPGKVRLATIPLVIIALGTLLYVIVTHLLISMGALL